MYFESDRRFECRLLRHPLGGMVGGAGAARPLRDGSPFLGLRNLIGSPHNSAGGRAWRDEYLRRAAQKLPARPGSALETQELIRARPDRAPLASLCARRNRPVSRPYGDRSSPQFRP